MSFRAAGEESRASAWTTTLVEKLPALRTLGDSPSEESVPQCRSGRTPDSSEDPGPIGRVPSDRSPGERVEARSP